jgi:hypothetical protein
VVRAWRTLAFRCWRWIFTWPASKTWHSACPTARNQARNRRLKYSTSALHIDLPLGNPMTLPGTFKKHSN